PVGLDGGDIPSSAGVEGRFQLFLTDGVRATIGTIVTKAQHVQGSVVLGHRRKTCHVSRPFVAVSFEGVEQSAVEHGPNHASQTLEMERVSRGELNLDAAGVRVVIGLGLGFLFGLFAGLFSGDCQCRLRHVNAQDRQSRRGGAERNVMRNIKSVLARPAARIEHRSGEPTFRCQTHYCWLRPADIPRRRLVAMVRRIPRQSRHPFVTGWAPATERIVLVTGSLVIGSECLWSLRHPRSSLQPILPPLRGTRSTVLNVARLYLQPLHSLKVNEHLSSANS